MHWTRSAVVGLISGAVGVAAMTVGEKVEQRCTGRPDSFVPARTLRRLLGRPDTDRLSRAANLGMHGAAEPGAAGAAGESIPVRPAGAAPGQE